MQYKVSCCEPYVSLIKSGRKTVEGRLYRGVFAQLKRGDTVIWYDNYDSGTIKVKTEILGLNLYNSFLEMLQNEGLNNVLPNLNESNYSEALELGNEIYNGFYTKEDQQLHKVVGILVKVSE